MILQFQCKACNITCFVRLDRVTNYADAEALLPRRFCVRCMTPLGDPKNTDYPGKVGPKMVVLASEYPRPSFVPLPKIREMIR